MRKRLVCLIMGVVMTTLLFTGCDSKAKEEDKKAQEQDNVSEKYVNGNSIGNIRNEGKILDYGKYIIYASGKGVYKVNKDGSEYEKLSDMSDCTYLNFYNDSIYCVYKDTALYKMNIDGSESEEVVNGYGELPFPYGVIIDEDIMYIGCEYIVDLSKLAANNNRFILGEIYCTKTTPMKTINVVDDNIFFYGKETSSKREKGGIYKMNWDGTQMEKIYEGYVYFCIIDGEWAYCWDYANTVASVFRYKLDGTEKEVLLDYSDADDDTYITGLNVTDGWIYYELSDSPDESQNGIYKMKTDGTEKQLLTNNRSYEDREGIYVVDEWVYYCPEESSNELWRVKVDGTEDGLFVSFD